MRNRTKRNTNNLSFNDADTDSVSLSSVGSNFAYSPFFISEFFVHAPTAIVVAAAHLSINVLSFISIYLSDAHIQFKASINIQLLTFTASFFLITLIDISCVRVCMLTCVHSTYTTTLSCQYIQHIPFSHTHTHTHIMDIMEHATLAGVPNRVNKIANRSHIFDGKNVFRIAFQNVPKAIVNL